jgi:hypothetical protein
MKYILLVFFFVSCKTERFEEFPSVRNRDKYPNFGEIEMKIDSLSGVFPDGAGETTSIVSNDTCFVWFMNAAMDDSLYYTYATDSLFREMRRPVAVLPKIIYPYVVKYNDIFYLFGHRMIAHERGGDISLWSSIDKIHWTILNGGDPIIKASTDTSSIYQWITNPGVLVLNGVFHVWIECAKLPYKGKGLAYTYSTISNNNWEKNKTKYFVVKDNAGNPNPVLVEKRQAIIMIHGGSDDDLNSGSIHAEKLSLTKDFSLVSSYIKCPNFNFKDEKPYTEDPDFFVTNSNKKKYKIMMRYLHDQRATFIAYCDLSLNQFFDIINLNKTTNRRK